jgi:DNA polymerase III gamma/tau subunit
LKYRGFGANPQKIIIMDECHRLSAAAWSVLLKPIEEPPEHVYWVLCTTEASKVPATIKSRCQAHTLRSVPISGIESLLEDIKSREKLKFKDEVLRLIAREAAGSPRRALVGLAACIGAKTRREAADRLATVEDEGDVRKLCQLLMKGGTWTKAMALIEPLEKMPPETIRILVVNYMAAVAHGSSKPHKALSIIEEFNEPFRESDKLAPLYLAIGNVIYD